jgi:predicted GIY-YIG superfamily endonuclease
VSGYATELMDRFFTHRSGRGEQIKCTFEQV